MTSVAQKEGCTNEGFTDNDTEVKNQKSDKHVIQFVNLKHDIHEHDENDGNLKSDSNAEDIELEHQNQRERQTKDQNAISNTYGVANKTIIVDDSEQEIPYTGIAKTSLPKNVSFSGPNVHQDRNSFVADDGLVEQTTPVKSAPDGGWGWFIVLSSLIIHLVVGGIDRSGGILYLKFEEKFQTPAAITAWVPAMSNGLRLAFGPIVSVLCNRYSYRTVVICGSLILSISAMISAFAPNLYFLFFSYGLIGGTGHAMTYSPGVVFLNVYFRQKLGTAVGLATSGVGIGAFVVPLLLEACFMYYGYMGSFMILSGLALQMVVCGALMRPISLNRRILEFKTKTRKNSSRNSVGSNTSSNGQPKEKTISNKRLSKEVDVAIKVHKAPNTFQGVRRLSIMRKSSMISILRRMSTAVPFLTGKGKGKKGNQKLFDMSLLKDMRYSAFCIAILFFTLAFQAGFVFLPAFAKQIDATDFESAYTIVISGICDGIGRILAGFLFDVHFIKPYRVYLYNVMILLMGLISFAIPSARNFEELAFICAFYGFTVGMYVSQKSVIIVDLLGAEKLANSFGLLLFFQGVGTFIGPPLTGLLKDINGSYDYAFYFGGSGVLFGSLVMLGTNIIHYVQSRNTYNIDSHTPKDTQK